MLFSMTDKSKKSKKNTPNPFYSMDNLGKSIEKSEILKEIKEEIREKRLANLKNKIRK